eukprot:scaffold87524_cov60-Phaeocystis_antarctica.AAC.2
MPRLEVATHALDLALAGRAGGRNGRSYQAGCVALGGTCRDLTRSAILLRHTMRCAAILAKKFPALRCGQRLPPPIRPPARPASARSSACVATYSLDMSLGQPPVESPRTPREC